jgi:hypothetical protein
MPVSDFIQRNPDDGKTASSETKAWLAYDAQNLYGVSPLRWFALPIRICRQGRRFSRKSVTCCVFDSSRYDPLRLSLTLLQYGLDVRFHIVLVDDARIGGGDPATPID